MTPPIHVSLAQHSKMGQGRGPSHSNAHTNNANRLPYKHFPLVG